MSLTERIATSPKVVGPKFSVPKAVFSCYFDDRIPDKDLEYKNNLDRCVFSSFGDRKGVPFEKQLERNLVPEMTVKEFVEGPPRRKYKQFPKQHGIDTDLKFAKGERKQF